MREQTTLLLEKEVEEKTEKKVKSIVVSQKSKEQTKSLFSSPVKAENVIEKPNFDKMPELPKEKRKTVFKVEAEEKKSEYKVNKKLKLGLIGLCFALLLSFCITSSIEIAKANRALEAEQSSYSVNLGKLLRKIKATESENEYLSLFETYPEKDLGAESFYETTNWFDKFCSFLTNFFGG